MLKSRIEFIKEIELVDTLNSYLNEKLAPSVAKKFTQIEKNPEIQKYQDQVWSKLQTHDKFMDKSKRGDRLYFEFEPDETASKWTNIYEIVENIFRVASSFLDYKITIEDYQKGIAKRHDNGQQIKIGKLLNKLAKMADKSPKMQQEFRNEFWHHREAYSYSYNNLYELKNAFDSDPDRQGATAGQSDLLIVLSRHSYDIAGMSADRGWTSCLDVYKENTTTPSQMYVSKDIKYGSIIAYLIKSKDKNIQNPLGRVLIRPFIKVNSTESEEDEKQIIKSDTVIYLTEEATYGTTPPSFRTQVYQIVDSVQNTPNPGKYEIQKEVYCDIEDDVGVDSKIVLSDELKNAIQSGQTITDSQIIREFLNNIVNLKDSEYFINSDLSVNINDDFFIDIEYDDISIQEINYIPIKLNKVYGTASFVGFGLKSLFGAPDYVEENFECHYNNIQSLEGGPNQVGLNYICHKNNLKTLEGLAESIGGNLTLPKHLQNEYSEDQIRQISDIQGEIKFM
jgi:hypothetical protein